MSGDHTSEREQEYNVGLEKGGWGGYKRGVEMKTTSKNSIFQRWDLESNSLASCSQGLDVEWVFLNGTKQAGQA